ncbi:hypothetical protein [Crateriforma conspicua]|uniref:hypothetical protein n=1 Tax=Crateriforma conspicua TaxID=2527996 RepID=UPI0018CE1CD5|nr:hypothetical protein [Crateriforma conspicua]
MKFSAAAGSFWPKLGFRRKKILHDRRSRLGLLERKGDLFVRKSRLLHGHLLLGMTARFYPITLILNESAFRTQVSGPRQDRKRAEHWAAQAEETPNDLTTLLHPRSNGESARVLPGRVACHDPTSAFAFRDRHWKLKIRAQGSLLSKSFGTIVYSNALRPLHAYRVADQVRDVLHQGHDIGNNWPRELVGRRG